MSSSNAATPRDSLKPADVPLSNSRAMDGAPDDYTPRRAPDPSPAPSYADQGTIEKVAPWTPEPPQGEDGDGEPDYGDLTVLEDLNVREGLRHNGDPTMFTPIARRRRHILGIAGIALVGICVALLFVI